MTREDERRPALDPGSGVPIVAEQSCCDCDDRWQPCSCWCHA